MTERERVNGESSEGRRERQRERARERESEYVKQKRKTDSKVGRSDRSRDGARGERLILI